MALSHVLTNTLLDTTNDTLIYTAGGTDGFQGNIFVTCSSGTFVRVGLVPQGETYGQKHDILRVNMETNSSVNLTGICLRNGDMIYASAGDANSISVTVTGFEIS